MTGRLLSVGALALFALPGAALAQSYSCAIPAQVGDAAAARGGTEERRIAPVTGYTLALSWSPGFCRQSRNGPRFQCGGENRFGFVLHGLWPEASGADWPQYCARAVPIPAAVVRQTLCVMPSPGLQAHQYAKHGSCSGMAPAAYFAKARAVYGTIRYPDINTLSRQPGLTAGRFATAFARANPGLSPAMIRVQAGADGWLDEVRVCLDARFRPRACPMNRWGRAERAPLRIWRGR